MVVAAVAMAETPQLDTAAGHLLKMGVMNNKDECVSLLNGLQQHLKRRKRLNNLYLYITYRCQLKCSHCYLYDENLKITDTEMKIKDLQRIIRDAKSIGFRQVVILGGEPLIHKEIHRLLAELKRIRDWAAPLNLVLRTNGSVFDRCCR